MAEGRHLLRFVIPGALCLFEVALILLGVMPDWTIDRLTDVGEQGNIGVAVGALLTSGAFGFLLSILHHVRHSHSTAANHWPFLDSIKEQVPIPSEADRNSIPDGWAVFNALWHARRETHASIKGATERANTLGDLVHSVGTAQMALTTAVALSAIIVAFVSRFTPTDDGWRCATGIVTVALVVILLAVHQTAYQRTARSATLFVEQVLKAALDQGPSRRAPVGT